MVPKIVKNTILLLAVSVLAASPVLANERMVRSLVFPGMGQLGDGQTGKGLLYMAGEIALLSMTFSSLSEYASQARQTVYDSVQIYNEGGFSEARTQTIENWQESVDNANSARMMTFAFAGASVVWWAWNVVDALIFVPRDTGEMSLYRKVKDNTVVGLSPDGVVVGYTMDF
jgi:hypothetical protein